MADVNTRSSWATVIGCEVKLEELMCIRLRYNNNNNRIRALLRHGRQLYHFHHPAP